MSMPTTPSSSASRIAMPTSWAVVDPRLRSTAISLRRCPTDISTTRPIKVKIISRSGTLKAYRKMVSERESRR